MFLQKRTGWEVVTSVNPTSIQVRYAGAVADHGDSGGPLLWQGAIAGTTSCHIDGGWPMHRVEYYARTDAVRNWIAERLEAWDDPSCILASDCNPHPCQTATCVCDNDVCEHADDYRCQYASVSDSNALL